MFWAESEPRETKFRIQNIYCECFFQERIEEIGEKQFQSDVHVRHAFEKSTRFWQNLKFEKPKLACRTFNLNAFWNSALKKLAQSSLGTPCPRDTNRF